MLRLRTSHKKQMRRLGLISVKNVIVVMVFFATSPYKAMAGVPPNLFGEASLGYDISQISASNVVPPNESASTSSFAVEARAGYNPSIFLLGVSVAGTLGSLSYSNPTLKNGTWNKAFTYLFAGLDLGAVRFWGDYAVFDQLRVAYSYPNYSTDKIYSGGQCWKVGVGAALTQRIHLNAEFYSNSPNQMQNSGGTVNWSNTYSSWQETGYIFSVAYEILGSEIHSK